MVWVGPSFIHFLLKVVVLVLIYLMHHIPPGWASLVALPTNAEDSGDMDSVLESGRSPGEGNNNPLQYSCLENAKDRGVWQAAVHGITNSQT